MRIGFCVAAIAHASSATSAQAVNASPAEVEESLDIAKVPSGFPVGFCLLTHGKRQYVAYYDVRHDLTVAARDIDSNKWQYKVLPSRIGWDSHNYITMAIDNGGYLHLSGNMHAAPLVYFRTSEPGDIATFKQINSMTGANENRCTYPAFLRGVDNRLIFHYRDGGSGNGREIYNTFDSQTKSWKRFSDRPLIDGLGKRNAYMSGPTPGPDGMFHLCWVWRDKSDCQTNHDPSYARSRDLIQWETVDGKPLDLPITIGSQGTLVDHVAQGGGIINGAIATGFDSAKRPLVSYHKFDGNGKTQAYVARFENGKWMPHQITAWDYRWEFNGGGTIEFAIHLGAIHTHGPGKLALPYSHIKYGGGLLVIDEKTLQLLGTEKQPNAYPVKLCKPESEIKGMKVNWRGDMGITENHSIRYVLRWETLPPNRDRPREGPQPAPSMLRVYRIRTAANPPA